MASTPKSRSERVYENGYSSGYAAGRKSTALADRLSVAEFKADFYGRLLQRAVDELHEMKAALSAQQSGQGAGRNRE
ncbi:hypothetical protein LMG3482_01873 [Achromobacter deleyi]|uniref:hypothetical protein n=1 Tax=Achromobacter deleyi TaxID=1353891 RepID=UPI0014662F47|nr:hypothetical protein [Achromobacter deleyi]CAB3846024.1 hypothetical protein LMG3481_01510 [Achromobacter deleyi]CAB3853087.1 hypothetical protein LMG3482_01873 [Achromobacter deleyi]